MKIIELTYMRVKWCKLTSENCTVQSCGELVRWQQTLWMALEYKEREKRGQVNYNSRLDLRQGNRCQPTRQLHNYNSGYKRFNRVLQLLNDTQYPDCGLRCWYCAKMVLAIAERNIIERIDRYM